MNQPTNGAEVWTFGLKKESLLHLLYSIDRPPLGTMGYGDLPVDKYILII
jgi:hypothetical protein